MINCFEDTLDKIRVDIYEKTKNMTNYEAVQVTNKNARRIADEYGIKLIKNMTNPNNGQKTITISN